MIILTIGVFPTYHGSPTIVMFQSQGSKQVPAFFLDGSGGAGCGNTTSRCTITLTTAHGNDVIVAFATEILDLQTSCTFNISDTTNLSWKARSNAIFGEGGRAQLQEFWALSQTPLSNDNVTESIAGCGTNYNNIMIFAIKGADPKSPFDPNTALPAMASGFGGESSVQVSTSNPDDFIFAAVLHGNFPPFPTAQPGFTIITPQGTNAVEYAIVNATLTNVPVTFEDGAIGVWLSMGDALQLHPTI